MSPKNREYFLKVGRHYILNSGCWKLLIIACSSFYYMTQLHQKMGRQSQFFNTHIYLIKTKHYLAIKND